jgi:hypothetical protein
MPISKQLNGALLNGLSPKVHSSPVTSNERGFSDSRKGGINSVASSVVSVKVPTISNKVIDEVQTFNLLTEVVTDSNTSTKTFTIHTGLPESEPTVLLTSEFNPLYESGYRSKQGTSISLKEGSKIVNAKAATTMLSNSPDVKSVIEVNKQDLQSYINEENEFLGQLITRTDSVLTTFDVGLYSPGFYGTLSFKNTLTRNGYSSQKIENFSSTKLWQQSLIETKKSLLSHTSDFISQDFVRSSVDNDYDSLKISDIDVAPNNIKKLWLNPYNNNSLSDYEKSQFVNLKYANVAEKMIVAEGGFVGEYDRQDSSTGQLFFSNQILHSFEDSGKDISILSNMLFKEASYSSFLGKKDNLDVLQSKFGYTVSTTGDNFLMWDYVIGQASKSATDFFKTPVGNGNSLISFSQNLIPNGQDSYKVLTFENDFIENTNTTPGTYYFVDSSLSTADGKNFDLSRLDHLINLSNSAHDTTKMIIEMLGHELRPFNGNPLEDLTGLGEAYPKKETADVFDLEGLVNRLSGVTQTYQKCLKISSDSIQSLQTTLFLGFFSKEEFLGVRLVALLCKSLVSPVASYATTAKKIKPLMFQWLMSIVMKEVQGSNNSGDGPLLKTLIASQFSSVRISPSSEEIAAATDEARTIPITTGTAPYIGDTSALKDVTVDYGTMEDLWSWLAVNYNDDGNSGYTYWRDNLTSAMGNPTDARPNGKLDRDLYNEAWDALRLYLSSREEELSYEISTERRQAYNGYTLSVAGRLFSIDESKGLWRVMIDILKTVYTNSDLYTNSTTNYSSISRDHYLYTYFDLMLRIIAAQTPENILGTYTTDYQYKTNNISAQNYTEDAITIHETGFLIDKPSRDSLNQTYNASLLSKGFTASQTVNKLSAAISTLAHEEESIVNEIGLFRRYFLALGASLNQYKSFLFNNFQSHLSKLSDLFQQDASLEDKKKNALINLTFSQGQIKLSKYCISEMSDRLNQNSEISAKLKSIPAFSAFPNDFIDYMPVNETELVSYTMLSPYFKSNEFLKAKGNNKKLMSVGIPPKLIQKLVSSVRLSTNIQNGMKQGIVRIKLYKLDRLHPDIVFLPQTYLFDMNRYPTRVISNWNYDAFYSDETNILSMPSKVVKPDGTIVLHRDFTQSFPADLYGDYLSDEDKVQMYANHCKSFLSEEYLRWFTDCRFDETRYNNFSKLSGVLSGMEQQFQAYINIVTNSVTAQTATTAQNTVTAQFTDPVSGNPLIIPVNPKEGALGSSSKKYVIPMNDTIRTFFMNETFLSDTSIYKRRISYPKKFDRVFNIIVDPDDFIVDESMSTKATIDALVNLGVLVGGSLGDIKIPYRHRDKSPDDITLDEYFVTVEPYDYVQEYGE